MSKIRFSTKNNKYFIQKIKINISKVIKKSNKLMYNKN